MYDSRTHKPIMPGTHRYATEKARRTCSWVCCDPRPEQQSKHDAIQEGLVAHLDETRPAREVWSEREVEQYRVSQTEIDKAHDLALSANNLPAWERELVLFDDFDTWGSKKPEYTDQDITEAYAWLDERDDLIQRAREDAAYDAGYDGYSHDDCWLPHFSIADARQHFGGDMYESGFHITRL